MKYGRHIPHFRGVFMVDTLPKNSRQLECGIVNLDKSSGPGTHWVAYWKNRNKVEYFDSYGNLQPPKELIKYLGEKITYNKTRFQKFNSYNCGHLCLKFLYSK